MKKGCMTVRNVLWFLAGALIVFLWCKQSTPDGKSRYLQKRLEIADPEEVVLVSVVCGNGPNFKEFLTFIKSAILFQTSSKIRLLVVSEYIMHPRLDEKLKYLTRFANNSFKYQLLNTSSFPVIESKEFKEFEGERPCASQRLLFPNVLQNENYILYLDTDTIFLNELSIMWRNVHLMSANHVAGMVLEFENPTKGYYAKIAKTRGYPVFRNQGLNSGVMFMGLDMMREFQWVDRIARVISEYGSKFVFHDQDAINILFHQHPDRLYVAPCTCNYRPPHCRHENDCPGVEETGVTLVHGAGGFFQKKSKWNPFSYIYETFEQFELGTDPHQHLVKPLQRKIKMLTQMNCRRRINAFLKNLMRLYPEPRNASLKSN